MRLAVRPAARAAPAARHGRVNRVCVSARLGGSGGGGGEKGDSSLAASAAPAAPAGRAGPTVLGPSLAGVMDRPSFDSGRDANISVLEPRTDTGTGPPPGL
jgi:hypothetical protein